MRAVRTKQNLDRLEGARGVDPALFSLLGGLWRGLCSALFPGVPEETCDLTDAGFIVLLERGDDVRDLRHVGLTGRGIPGCSPEFVEAHEVGGRLVFIVAVLYNNETMMFFVLPSGDFDEDTEAWLRTEAGLSPQQAPDEPGNVGAVSTPDFSPYGDRRQDSDQTRG